MTGSGSPIFRSNRAKKKAPQKGLGWNGFYKHRVGQTSPLSKYLEPDGLTIVGTGINPDGFTEAWIATVPEPGTVSMLALGGVALLLVSFGAFFFTIEAFNSGDGRLNSLAMQIEFLLRISDFGFSIEFLVMDGFQPRLMNGIISQDYKLAFQKKPVPTA